MHIFIQNKDNFTATQLYRVNPFIEAAKSLGVTLINNHNLPNLHPKDLQVVVIHQPKTEAQLSFLKRAKKNGSTIIIDQDDLIWNIPTANPSGVPMDYADVSANTIEALRLADVITVSTFALGKEIQNRFNPSAKILVIPNAFPFDTARLDAVQYNHATGKQTILWRGSNSHVGDLYTHREAFEAYPNIDYKFFGYNPFFLSKQYGGTLDVSYIPKVRLSDYFERLAQIKPQFVVVPLEKHPFNDCKSPIAAFEATLAGAVVIAPSYASEFKDFPSLKYDTVLKGSAARIAMDKLGNKFEGLVALQDVFSQINDGITTEHYQSIFEQQKRYIQQNYDLKKINQLRVDVIKELM